MLYLLARALSSSVSLQIASMTDLTGEGEVMIGLPLRAYVSIYDVVELIRLGKIDHKKEEKITK